MAENVGLDYLALISSLRDVRGYKDLILRMLNLREGESVLDVGCGTGTDVIQMAELFQGVRVIGVDHDSEMIEEARWQSASLALPIEFHVGDVYALDFPDNSFDACRADRVFQYLEDPFKALEEMIRVVQSQGRIIIYDSDWESLLISVDVEFEEITRKILNFSCDTSFVHGWIGRDLDHLCKRSGLLAVSTIPAVGIIQDYDVARQIFRLEAVTQRAKEAEVADNEEISLWLEHLEALGKSGYFFSSITGFIVTGIKA